MKTIFLILISTASLLSAQTVITFQGGINSRTGTFSMEPENSITQSWKSATSGSVGIDYFAIKSVAISASAEFDNYPFDTYRFDGASIPEIWVKSSTGDASQIYRAALEGKFFLPSSSRFSLYFVTGASYITEHIGQITLRMGNLNGPDYTVVVPSQSNNYWMHTFGLGFRYFVSDKIGIDVTGKWYSNYSTRLHKSLNFGIDYVL